jgi:hypothetical protein
MGIDTTLPPRVLELLQTTFLRVEPPMAASRLWEQVLSVADRRRLGLDFQSTYRRCGDTVGMWMELRGVTAERALVDVGQKLGFLSAEQRQWLLRELGEVDDDPETMVSAAVLAGGLVMVDSPRAVYWKGSEIELDWTSRSALWNYLIELARLAKTRQALDRLLFGREVDVNYLTKLKSSVKKLKGFPSDLTSRIVTAGRGSQRLDIEPTLIRIFERDTIETLQEWTS